MTNLGNTGEFIFDCYIGKCERCTDIYCDSYSYYTEYHCSSSCRRSSRCMCSPYSCSYKENDEYSEEKSCYANNLIYFWKEKFYNKVNMTYYGKYTYLNSAINASESCPEGRKLCGILDNLGNKLCYPNEIECPINYITKDIKNDSKSDYKEFKIDDTIYYYTNKKNETGRIVGGLYADSDLLIKYKEEDCELLETDSISSFLKSNNYKIYKKSLDFGPNEDENIDSKGKTFLKWCIPGVEKEERNISIIRELNEIYEYNVTKNKENVIPILDSFEKPYYLGLTAYILYFIFLILYFIYYCASINNCEKSAKFCSNFLGIECIILFFAYGFIIASFIFYIKPTHILCSMVGIKFINSFIVLLMKLHILLLCLQILLLIGAILLMIILGI